MLPLSVRLLFARFLKTNNHFLPLNMEFAVPCYKKTSKLPLFGGRSLCSSCICSRFVPLFGRNTLNSGASTERKVSACLARGFTSGVRQGNTDGVVWTNVKFKNRNKTTALYVVAVGITVLGLSYAAVPLYRLYCQATGLGGTVKTIDSSEKIEKMERKPERVLKIRFNADTSSTMRWKFKPQQSEVKLAPGETALAFYTATNPTDKPVTGISTYNVIPFDAGQYFNKIQCFCFEEQRLNPHEQVDMPVFFYIDPEFTEDPAMARVDTITLSYTFFEAKEAEQLGI